MLSPIPFVRPNRSPMAPKIHPPNAAPKRNEHCVHAYHRAINAFAKRRSLSSLAEKPVELSVVLFALLSAGCLLKSSYRWRSSAPVRSSKFITAGCIAIDVIDKWKPAHIQPRKATLSINTLARLDNRPSNGKLAGSIPVGLLDSLIRAVLVVEIVIRTEHNRPL